MPSRPNYFLCRAGLVPAVLFFLVLNSWGASSGRIIHTFSGHPVFDPQSGLIADAAGNLYGVSRGRPNDVVYELSPHAGGPWTVSILHMFSREEGAGLEGNLLLDQAGNLYGTAVAGGAHEYGSVFELSPNPDGSWTETTLYSFQGYAEGCDPSGGVVMDALGNLFGVGQCGAFGYGVAFELSPTGNGQWTERPIVQFPDSSPLTPLSFDGAGNLYGANEVEVFQITRNQDESWSLNIIHSFTLDDGFNPFAAVVFDAAGNLYGTTQAGGPRGGGTVFKMTNAGGQWSFTVLYGFSGLGDGGSPDYAVTLDPSGDIFGVTVSGGKYNQGTIFELSQQQGKWVESKHYSFTNGLDGGAPIGALLLREGNFYGPTQTGGGSNAGVVFQFAP